VKYYEIALLGKKLFSLTYSYEDSLSFGSIVTVPLQKRKVKGVVLREVEKPDFSVVSIDEVESLYYQEWQLELASFISTYYRCQIGEALQLMVPYSYDYPKADQIAYIESDIVLSPSQESAFKELLNLDFSLLFAPTGSGKTEIYIKLFEKILNEGGSALFLMPEISLTPQMQKRLEAYFGERVAIWHSKLTKSKRQSVLESIRNGTVSIVAGPRSALFLPMQNLKLIVVDEEHDDSYKAHNRPRYHARDLALWIGKQRKVRVVLGSATPSATSFAKFPIVRITKPYIKTRKRYIFEGGSCSLTSNMFEEIERHYSNGGQVIIFLPTRANFKYLYCDNCSYTVMCPFCSVGMSLHRFRKVVQCHYCGYAEKIPSSCAKCGSIIRSDRIGTAEVVEQLRERFPYMKIEQFDKDTITTASKLQKALDRFAKKETDILVGTQMLAKGHDYSDVTLAIILGLDYILGLPDFRARERAQSLFVQIAGRAGRAREATVIVQTNQPDFFREYIGKYEKFLQEELGYREGLYPPSMYLCRLLFASKNEAKAKAEVDRIKVEIEKFGLVEIVGAGKAPIEKIAGKFRFNILLRSSKRADLMRVIKAVDDGSFEVDMDPVDFA